MRNNLGNTIPRNGLVGEWPLDGDANASVGPNGTATNITWVKTNKGYQNKAGSFNGTNSTIPFTHPILSSISYSIWLKIDNTAKTNQFPLMGCYGIGALYLSYNHLTANQLTIGNFNGSSDRKIDCGSLSQGQWYHLVLTRDSAGNGVVYKDGIQIASGLLWTTNTSNTGAFGGAIGLFVQYTGELSRIYNRVLSQDEIQLLYLEGLRKLGPSAIASYPALFNGLVGYFENPTGTELWNIATGVKATYVGGTNTTDNLGINKAIINPNYTWSSITYTTGYTFENSGSGWNLVTSPAGLSATGINRTTTLRNIFLFNRTLSSDEVNTLYKLTSQDYIYPAPSYDLLSLREGLILDLDWNGIDQSGNGNNGTLVNSPTKIKVGKQNGLSYNGSNQRVDIPHNALFNFTNAFTISFDIKKNILEANKGIIGKWENQPNLGATNQFVILSTIAGKLEFYLNTGTTNSIATNTNLVINKLYKVTVKYDGSNMKIFINGVLDNTLAKTGNMVITGTLQRIEIGNYASNTLDQYFNGSIFRPKIRNRALSDKEIEAEYYGSKGNFIY